MSIAPLNCAGCPVSNRAVCAVLSPDERRDLERFGSTRQAARGETIFSAGDPHVACATLVSGALKLVDRDIDGNETIVSLIHPSGFTGELFASSNAYDVIALTDSRLCVFPQARFDEALERYPALAMALLKRSSEEIGDVRHLLSLATRKSARARLASLLLAFARAASHSPCHPSLSINIPLKRDEMADMIGLTIETVSRQLTALVEEGVIARKGRQALLILDLARLEQLAA